MRRRRREDKEARAGGGGPGLLATAARGRGRGLAVAALDSEGGCWSHRSHAIENPRLVGEIACLDVCSVYGGFDDP